MGLEDFAGLGEHILGNEVLADDEKTLVVKKLASLIRPRFGKRGLPPIKSLTGKVGGGPLSKVLASLGENLNRNYFWVNRAYKMSRLNSDNKLKFGKRSALKKRKRKLSPLNFTKQLFDSDLEEEDQDDDTDDRGLPYKPLFWEESDL